MDFEEGGMMRISSMLKLKKRRSRFVRVHWDFTAQTRCIVVGNIYVL